MATVAFVELAMQTTHRIQDNTFLDVNCDCIWFVYGYVAVFDSLYVPIGPVWSLLLGS